MRALVTFNKWPCFLSTILFYYGVLAHEVWCIIRLLIKKLVMKNSVPLSLLITFIVVSNCVWIKTTKSSKILTTSDFYFNGKTHVYLEKSSTMVKKYLWPWIDDNEYGPHILTWIKSKHFLDLDPLRGKGSLFCFGKWQLSQIKYLLYLTKGNLLLITSKDLFETCPNRKYQKVSRSLVVKLTVLVICEDLTGLIWRFW